MQTLWMARSKTSRLPAQTVKDDSATVPLQHHQFELPIDSKDDVETFPAAPLEWDVMPKARGVK